MEKNYLTEEEILEALISLEEKGLIFSCEENGELKYKINMLGKAVLNNMKADPKTRN